MIPQFGKYDFFLVVTNRSNSPKKHPVADVYANRAATNNPDRLVQLQPLQQDRQGERVPPLPGCVIKLKGADGQRYETRLARDPNIDNVREQLAYWVNSSDSLASLALAPESE